MDINFTLVLNADLNEVDVFFSDYHDYINVSVFSRTNNPSIFYQNADLVLNLSRLDLVVETFGLTIIEALSFGIPVIVPPVGGPAESISDFIEGFYIDSRDLSALTKAVLALADDPILAMKMSRAALNCSKNFTYESYSKRLREIITKVNNQEYLK
jgi:glycosyltransferase involved in cell wall biosynthesis